jgi:phosphoglycolate phosphatase
MLEAVIFDLDGTLLDTLGDIASAMNRSLVAHGFDPYPVNAYEERVGWGLTRLVTTCLPEDRRGDSALIDSIAEGMRRAYREHPVVETVPYPGIRELLADLRAAGVPRIVLSNKPDDLVQPVVAEIFGTDEFVRVLGQRPEEPRKPDPTTTRRILGEIGAEPGNVAFVGDSEIDMETAGAAGCIAVGVTWGFRPEEVIREAGADHVCYSIDHLRTVLGLEVKEEVV